MVMKAIVFCGIRVYVVASQQSSQGVAMLCYDVPWRTPACMCDGLRPGLPYPMVCACMPGMLRYAIGVLRRPLRSATARLREGFDL